ncbi:MAG: hypothetical protein ABEJ75_03955 [Candidatus Nanohaloarchaea archaeon]
MTGVAVYVFYASILVSAAAAAYILRSADSDREAWMVAGFGVLLGLLAAAAGMTGILGRNAEMLMGYLPAIPLPFAIAFLYRARRFYGGELARYFEIIAVGLVMEFLLYIPHLYWHFQEFSLGHLPSWGVAPSFWYVFFHGLSAFGFAVVSYGFYLLWKSGQ